MAKAAAQAENAEAKGMALQGALFQRALCQMALKGCQERQRCCCDSACKTGDTQQNTTQHTRPSTKNRSAVAHAAQVAQSEVARAPNSEVGLVEGSPSEDRVEWCTDTNWNAVCGLRQADSTQETINTHTQHTHKETQPVHTTKRRKPLKPRHAVQKVR